MLENTFTEEYRRYESPFDYNYSKVFENSSGDIILSSNYVLENGKINFDFTRKLGSNRIPNNTNLLIDSVSFLSTNPQLSGKTPFKFSFSGQVPEVDFSQPEITILDRFGDINTNNLGVLSNRFLSFEPFEIEIGTYTRIIFTHYDHSGFGVWFMIQTAVNYVLYYLGIGDRTYYREDTTRKLNYYLVELTNFLVVNYTPVRLDGNSKQTYLLMNNTLLNQREIYTLMGGREYYEVDGTLTSILPIVSTPVIRSDDLLAHTFNGLYLIMMFKTSGGNVEIEFLIYNQYYGANPLFNSDRRISVNTLTLSPNSPVGVVEINAIDDLTSDRYFLGNRMWGMGGVGDGASIYQIDFGVGTFSVSLIFNTGIINAFRIIVGRNQIGLNAPRFTIVTDTDTPEPTAEVHFILGGVSSLTKTFTYPVGELFEISEGLDNISLFNNSVLEIFNLVDGSNFTYNFNDLPSLLTPVPFRYNFGLASRYFIYGIASRNEFNTGGNPTNLIFNIAKNVRYPKNNNVYKYTFHYDGDRIYPFSVNSSFNIDILGDDIREFRDLEIFKIIVDYRVRYSNEQYDPAPLNKLEESERLPELETCVEACEEPCEEGVCLIQGPVPVAGHSKGKNKKTLDEEKSDKKKKDCFTRCNRSVGSTSRVLGLVGEDFSVADFLNIYTSGI